ncbi:pilin [Patescibacteria group bacterium]|nr:pilin [Patescibacteria group bacterium]
MNPTKKSKKLSLRVLLLNRRTWQSRRNCKTYYIISFLAILSFCFLFFTPINAQGIFGNIQPPPGISNYIGDSDSRGGALFLFLNNIFKLIGGIAGIFTVFQFIFAGYTYITANADPKKLEMAWAKIWQAIIGLVIVSAAFILAAVIGRLTQINILEPEIYGPS